MAYCYLVLQILISVIFDNPKKGSLVGFEEGEMYVSLSQHMERLFLYFELVISKS